MDESQKLKELGKHTLIYGVGRVLERMVGLLLFPLYVRMLSESDFGTRALVLSAGALVATVLGLGLDSAATRHYYEANGQREKEAVLSSWLWVVVFASSAVCGILLWLAEPICSWAFADPALAPLFRLSIAAVPFGLVARVSLMVLRLTFQPVRYALICLAKILVQALLAIALVVAFRMGLAGVLLAIVISTILQGLAGLTLTHRNFRMGLSWRWLKPMLAFGLPLIPMLIAMWILSYSNQYFINRWASRVDVGALDVARRISGLLTVAISSFQIAWGPFAYSLVNDRELARNTYSKALTYFGMASVVAATCVSLFAREVIVVLATSKYLPATALVPWLCGAAILWGAFYVLCMPFGVAKKTYHMTNAVVLGAASNVCLSIALIPRFGINGAAAAAMLGYVPTIAYAYLASRRVFPVSYELVRLSTLGGLAVAATAGGICADQCLAWPWPCMLAAKSALFAAFVAGLFLCKVLQPSDLGRVWKSLLARMAARRQSDRDAT